MIAGRKRSLLSNMAILAAITLGLIGVAELFARAVYWHADDPKVRFPELGTVSYGFNPGGFGDLMPEQDGI